MLGIYLVDLVIMNGYYEWLLCDDDFCLGC